MTSILLAILLQCILLYLIPSFPNSTPSTSPSFSFLFFFSSHPFLYLILSCQELDLPSKTSTVRKSFKNMVPKS